MTFVCSQFQCFVADESGATAIEYGLIAGLVAVGMIVALTLAGTSVTGMFEYVSTRSGEQLDNINEI